MVAAHIAAAKRAQPCPLERDEAAIVAEELVAAGPGQADLHVLGHEAVDVPGGKPAAVRLVERPDHLQEIVEQLVRVDDRLVVVGAPALGERARERQLVVLAREAERVRAHAGAALREQRGHGRRVEAARERDGDGDVGERPANDRVAQPSAQLARIARRSPNSSFHQRCDVGTRLLEVVAEHVPRRKPLHAREDRALARDEAQAEVVEEALAVELALDPGNVQQRAQLRRERERRRRCSRAA